MAIEVARSRSVMNDVRRPVQNICRPTTRGASEFARTSCRNRWSAATIVSAVLVALTVGACASTAARSPEDLRRRYAQALERDDPDAAYALLSPGVQAKISPEAFRKRWRSLKKERETSRKALNQLDPPHQKPIRGGVTTHHKRDMLTWVDVGGNYVIAAGLPSIPSTSTPAQAIRAFVAAIRTADFGNLNFLLTDDLHEAMADNWEARLELIEERLSQPDAIEYSKDMRRASLRYEPGRALTLEQTPAGWRFSGLQ